MRSSAIHALACAFLSETLHLTLSGLLFGLSLSCISVCKLVCVSSQSENRIQRKNSHIFQTLSLLLRPLLLFCLSARSLQAEGQPETCRTELLLESGSWEPVAQRQRLEKASLYPHTHQKAETQFLNMHSDLWVSNCGEAAKIALSFFSICFLKYHHCLYAEFLLWTRFPQLLPIFIMVCVIFFPCFSQEAKR